MQCFHYVDFIRRANSPSASLPTRLLRVCLEGLETSLLMWVDAGVELETPWEEECVCVCVFMCMHTFIYLLLHSSVMTAVFSWKSFWRQNPHLYILYTYIKIRKNDITNLKKIFFNILRYKNSQQNVLLKYS